MLRRFAGYNAETGKISCGKFLSSFLDLIEESGYSMNIGNIKQMWVYKKGMWCDSVCVFSGTVKKGER